MGRTEDSRKIVNRNSLYAAGIGLLPFRFAAPAVAALGVKMLKDVREVFAAEVTPIEQVLAAAVLGAGEFALGQSTRATRLVPWVGPVLSGAVTGVAFKALGEGAIAYYTWARHASAVDPTPSEPQPDAHTRVAF